MRAHGRTCLHLCVFLSGTLAWSAVAVCLLLSLVPWHADAWLRFLASVRVRDEAYMDSGASPHVLFNLAHPELFIYQQSEQALSS